MRRIAGPTAPLPSPSSRRASEERPELGGGRAADHRAHGEQDPAAHEQRRVPAVGEAGERELGDEAGEESGGDDEPSCASEKP